MNMICSISQDVGQTKKESSASETLASSDTQKMAANKHEKAQTGMENKHSKETNVSSGKAYTCELLRKR